MAKVNDLPIFRPKFGRGPRPTSHGGIARFRNAILANVRQQALTAGTRHRGTRSRVALDPRAARSRRVIVKARVVKLTGRSAKAAALHLAYIEREGVEKDGSKGVLYGAEGPIDRNAFAQPLGGEKHQFRLILSPEDAAELELTEYVRRYMQRIERDLGRQLIWAAVNHHDTDHPHAHIVLRGVDREGREIRLDRDYVAHGLRARAEELATEELGPRKPRHLELQRAREVTQDRFTTLDRELAQRAKDNRVEVGDLRRSPARHIDPGLLLARLEHLEELRLAERVSPRSWALSPGWQNELRELGMRGDIIKQMHRALRGDPGRYRIALDGLARHDDEAGHSPILRGRVAAKGLADELQDRFYAIVETPRGEGYYIPLHARAAAELRVGDLVSLGTDPRHARRGANRLGSEGVPSESRAIANKDDVDLGERNPKLKQENAIDDGMRNALPTSKERVGNFRDSENSNAIEPASPAQQHPMYLPTRVVKSALGLDKQVHERAPVWLDRVVLAELAPFGFGAQVRDALAGRHRVLRELGVDPADPARFRKLRELERQKIAAEYARGSGEQFVSQPPNGFRGQLRLLPRGDRDGSYAVVSDGARFGVIRVTHEAKEREGKVVTLSRDAEGRLRVRGTEKDRGLG